MEHPEDCKYGLAPSMKLHDPEFEKANQLALFADKDHDAFEERHAKNCEGMFCPKNDVVEADIKKKRK